MSFLDNLNNANNELKNFNYSFIENGIDNIDVKKFFKLGKEKSPLLMYVGGNEFTEFLSLKISYSIDSACAAFSFDTIFYPNKTLANRIVPFGNESVGIYYNDKKIFSGKIEKITTGYSNNGSNINIQGRSDSGILVDSDLTKSQYAITSLSNIAINNGFLFVREEPTNTFTNVKIDNSENAYDKLSKLALSKGQFAIPKFDGTILFANIENFTKSGYTIKDGEQNVLGISASYDISKRNYRYIGYDKNAISTILDTGISPTRGQKYIRTDEVNSDRSQVARMAMAKSINESFTLAVSLSTWTLNDKLIQPGMIIAVNSPMNMIYKDTEFVTKQIDYSYDINNGYVCEIQLTLKEAFDKNIPNINTFTTYQNALLKDPFLKFFKIPDNKLVWKGKNTLE